MLYIIICHSIKNRNHRVLQILDRHWSIKLSKKSIIYHRNQRHKQLETRYCFKKRKRYFQQITTLKIIKSVWRLLQMSDSWWLTLIDKKNLKMGNVLQKKCLKPKETSEFLKIVCLISQIKLLRLKKIGEIWQQIAIRISVHSQC